MLAELKGFRLEPRYDQLPFPHFLPVENSFKHIAKLLLVPNPPELNLFRYSFMNYFMMTRFSGEMLLKAATNPNYERRMMEV